MARPCKNAARTQACSLLPPDAAPLPEIPADEHPHPLPAGWKWVRLGSVATIIMGQSPAGSDTTDDASFMPLVGGASDMRVLYPDAQKYTKRPTKISTAHDIIICIRATLGKPIFSDGEYCLGRGVAAIRSASINRIFLRFFLINFEQYLYDHATGSTFAQVSSATLAQMPFPLPPREEQERIVARLESLFARLDEAREKVDAVAERYETRKAALLHKAFSGELTAKWREEKGVTKDSWKEKDFAYLIKNIEAGKNLRCEERPPQDGEIGIVKVSAVTWGTFNEFESKTCIKQPIFTANVQIKKGDFLFSRANTIQLVGNCVIVENISKTLMLSDKILRFTFNTWTLDRYVLYFSMSPYYRFQIVSLASGNQDGMRNISQKNLLKIKIPLPTLAEQEEIVRLLDSLLERERRIREAAEQVRERIDLMKKAILARAFRGELG